MTKARVWLTHLLSHTPFIQSSTCIPRNPQPIVFSLGPNIHQLLTLDSTTREGLAAPPRRPRSRKVSCPLTRSNGDLVGDMVHLGEVVSVGKVPLGSSQP